MLSDRILSASTDDEAREVLEALWRKTRGDEYVRTGINHFYAFQATLDARAYLSAAEMLVPEGVSYLLASAPAKACCNIHEKPIGEIGVWHDAVTAPTAWQALAAAIAKTREVAP